MNSRRYLKIFLGITLGFGVLHAGSLLVFLASPELFYHRALEYFIDIGYRVKDMPISWHRPEFGDLARDNFFLYRDPHVTSVSTDTRGFRARPIEATSYPIMVAGDSTIFGLRLSDDETLPWRLALAIERPVFNAGRFPFSLLLDRPEFSRLETLIDSVTERNIRPRVLRKGLDEAEDMAPEITRDLTMMQAVALVPPRRYSLPLLAIDATKRIANDIRVEIAGGPKRYLFRRHVMNPTELDETVALIVERKKAIEARGIRYVFMPVPAKQTLYAPDVDDYTRNFIPTLVARLRAEGVEAVDLATPFQAEKERGLFFPYDTHWNANGTEIAARVVAREIFGR